MSLWTRSFAAAMLTTLLALVPATASALEPFGQVIGPDFGVREVNNAGEVVGNHNVVGGRARVWSDGFFRTLDPLLGGTGTTAADINASGAAAGATEFPDGPGGYPRARATRWSPSGSPTDLGALNEPDGQGFSGLSTINDSGFAGGGSSYCRDGATGDCSGPLPAAGNGALGLLVPPTASNSLTGDVKDINGAGRIVGDWQGAGGNWTWVEYLGGGAFTKLPDGFQPVRILEDGRMVGVRSSFGTSVLNPDGSFERIACGDFPWDANDAGDVLVFGNFKQSIWHEGVCYDLASVAPDELAGYSFPSVGASTGSPSINGLGQVATFANGPSGQVAVLMYPKYPLAIEVTSAPTATPGEFEFDTIVTRGVGANRTTTWDFGDRSAPVSSPTKVTKRYTKPGTYTVTARTVDGEGKRATATSTVEVAAPRLLVGISLPNHETGPLPLGEVVDIVVNVGASADGVGDLSEIAFQGGTFRVSRGDLLEFTTASTSPFSLSPGTGNTYPLKVRTVKAGDVRLDTLVIGKDALGRSVSGTTDREVTIAAGASPAPGPGPAPGAPQPPAADTTGPLLSIPAKNKSLTASRSGVVPFALGPVAEDTTGVIALKTDAKKKALSLGKRSFQVRKGQKVVVKIKLSRAGRKLLSKQKRIKVVAAITLRDAQGNATIRSYRFTIKAPRAKKKG